MYINSEKVIRYKKKTAQNCKDMFNRFTRRPSDTNLDMCPLI